MVEFKEAYKIANEFFQENDYVGVLEARENEDNWLFEGKCRHTCYGTSEVCVPKNGDEPYLFNIAHETHMWDEAKIVSV